MKLIWHIFKKDLRRLWLPLLGWGAIIALQFIAFRSGRTNPEQSNHQVVMWLWGLHLLVGWLLTARLVQDDSLTSDTAAWRVRPVSGARLLATKLLGLLVLLCLWPSLFTIPWWLDIGMGPLEVVRAVALNTLGMAIFLSVAMLIATLTDDLGRFIAWSLVLAAAAALGAFLLAAGVSAGGGQVVTSSVLMTRAWLVAGLVVVAVVTIIPFQYLKRRALIARSLAAGGAILAALVMQWWPWTLAQMQSWTGLQRYALPTVTAKPGHSALFMPTDPARQKTAVQLGVELEIKDRALGDVPWLRETTPRWRFGENRWTDLPNSIGSRPSGMGMIARELAGGRMESPGRLWPLSVPVEMPGSMAERLRRGEGAVSARNRVSVWRGEKGPSVVLRSNERAGASAGLRLLHINGLAEGGEWPGAYDGANMWWFDVYPLCTPLKMAGLVSPGGYAYTAALLSNGSKSAYTDWTGQYLSDRLDYLPNGEVPVGILALKINTSNFNRERWDEMDGTWSVERTDFPLEGSTLTLIPFHEAAPLEVNLAETAFVPDIVFEGRLDEAKRRAQVEGKLILVHVASPRQEAGRRASNRGAFPRLPTAAREMLTTSYVPVELAWDDAGPLRKPTDDATVGMIVILKSDGQEQDRLRDVFGGAGIEALQANLSGKTYAALLSERLAAAGGQDRKLRYQLHDALRARGELAGAFDAVLWLFDHPPSPYEGTDVFQVGFRIQRFVETYGPARGILLERREQALANLRQDPRNEGAARLLFLLTLGLQHDSATWMDFPRVMPRDNPLWWEFTRNWLSRTVSQRDYHLAASAVDLEKFFAEGPAWVRAQLMRRRPLNPGEAAAPVGVWQEQLVRAGMSCIDALAGDGQPEAALRLARAVVRVSSSRETANSIYWTLQNRGANQEAHQFREAAFGTK